ncbi:MAG: hypothetical protein WBX20_04285 [Terrimicrobiaceae bacterium]
MRWAGFFQDEDVVLAQAFAAAKVDVSGLMQSQKAIDAAAQQRSHGKEEAETAVAQNDAEMGPELPKELTFVHAEGAAGKMQERSAFEAEKTHQFHHGKAACFLLIGRLRIGSLILRGVGHRQAGAIDDFDLAGKPATLTGGVGFHALSEMAMDVQKHSIGKPLTGLHLREKRPEGDQGTKEPFSAASAPFVRGEQSSGNHRTESRSLHQLLRSAK